MNKDRMKVTKCIVKLVLGIFLILLLSCSKKEDSAEAVIGDSKKGKDTTKSQIDSYQSFLDKIDSSMISLLPSGTYGFMLFLNTDGIAKKQKEYWEKDLDPEVKELISASMSGFEAMLADIGVLEGRSVEDIYEMESAQFVAESIIDDVSSNQDEDTDPVTNSESKPSGKTSTHAGFIASLNLSNLHEKAESIAESLRKNASPAQLIKKESPAIIEFSEQGALIPAFKYLGLKDSYIVSASSMEIIEEVFSPKTKPRPDVFSDAEFSALAKKLPDLEQSVIFGGLKGDGKKSLPFAMGMQFPFEDMVDGSNENLHEEGKNLLIAFNQSFASSYAAQFRMKISDNVMSFLKMGHDKDESKSDELAKTIVTDSTIFSLDLSSYLTKALFSESKEQIMNMDPRLQILVEQLEKISVTINSIEQQRFLPVPSISFMLEAKNTEQVLPVLKEVIKDSLQANGMVPPGASWVPEGENGSTILTALGEEITIIFNEQFIGIGSSRPELKLLLGESTESSSAVLDISKVFSLNLKSTSVKDISLFFLNFKTLSQSLEKVFAMSGAFGAKNEVKKGEFNPEVLSKALAAIGVAGGRVYVEEEELVVNVKADRLIP
jgi:hypothetical protein